MFTDAELKLAYFEGKQDAYISMVGRIDKETDMLLDQYISRLSSKIDELMVEINKQQTA